MGKAICLSFIMISLIFYTPSFLGKKATVHSNVPNTNWEDVKPCGQFVNEVEEIRKISKCTGGFIKKVPYVYPPRCFIITTESKDVKRDPRQNLNYIRIKHWGDVYILGFYDPLLRTIFVVENKKAANTYRHEILHLIFDLLDDDPDRSHEHILWEECLGYIEKKDTAR